METLSLIGNWKFSQIDKNYCLSTPLHCIPKISFISTVSNSAISAISIQPVVYPIFLFCLLVLHWNPQKLHPTSPFLSQKVKLLVWNKLTYGRFFHGFITRATWNHVPWKLYCKQLVEQLAAQQLNLWASS